MLQANCKIVENVQVCGNFFRLALKQKQMAKKAQPGQFINIRIDEGAELLLRRPFSIHAVSNDTIHILYKAVGKGTELLSKKKPQQILNVIGPLGNSFSLVEGKAILIGGGTGVASLHFLAEQLIKKYQTAVTILIGAKTKEEILCSQELVGMGCCVKTATEDGSAGLKGVITDILKEHLSVFSTQPHGMYACGPQGMLKEVARLAQHFRIPCEVSLEEHMACGVGACMGCVVKIKNMKSRQRRGSPGAAKIKNEFEYKRVCKDGPVFKAEEVLWQ